MKIDRVFLLSFLASLLINTALLGFLFRFKPPETVKTVSVNISLEKDLKSSSGSKRKEKEPLLRGKNENVDSSPRSQREIEKKEIKTVKKRGIHVEKNRNVADRKKAAFRSSVKFENRVEQKGSFKIRKISSLVKGKKIKNTEKARELENKSGNKKKEKGNSILLHGKEAKAGRKKSSLLGSSEEAPSESEENSVGEKESKDYLKLVLQEVEKNKFYPLIARRMGIEGKVKLKIVIGKCGELLSVSVLSSDSEILKRAAVKTLKKCHFPPPPGGKFETELTIHYKLK